MLEEFDSRRAAILNIEYLLNVKSARIELFFGCAAQHAGS